MIRVTQQQIQWTAIGSLNEARSRLQEAQVTAMSGVEVEKPSDDPAAAARARVISSLLGETDQHLANVAHGTARLQTAESSLAEAGNLLVRAKELALYMANATQSSEERASAAIEIDQLRLAMIDLANTQHDGEYVFANVDTLTAPIDATGAFTYDVDTWDQVRSVEVGPSQTGEIGASGAHAFARRMADPNSVDVIGVLTQLSTDLRNDDPDAIRARIDELETAHGQVLAERSRTGTRQNRLETAKAAAEQRSVLFERLRSDLIDADAAEAFSNVTMAENTLQAAVAVSARIMGPSLLDRL